jgi:hypothetical protein
MDGGRAVRWKLLLGGLLLLGVAGVALYLLRREPQLANDPDELILFSVDGTKDHMPPEERGIPEGQETLYGYPVLGRVSITDPEKRREVLAAVREDIRAGSEKQNRCFYPRHLVRTVKDGKVVDVVICFQCHNYQTYRNGQPHGGLTPPIGSRSEPLLTQLFRDAGVPVAP